MPSSQWSAARHNRSLPCACVSSLCPSLSPWWPASHCSASVSRTLSACRVSCCQVSDFLSWVSWRWILFLGDWLGSTNFWQAVWAALSWWSALLSTRAVFCILYSLKAMCAYEENHALISFVWVDSRYHQQADTGPFEKRRQAVCRRDRKHDEDFERSQVFARFKSNLHTVL